MTDERFPMLVDGVLHESAPPHAGPAGFGVFDTLLVEGGLRWFEERHLARLRAACERFGIATFARFDVARELARLAAASNAERALIRTRCGTDPSSGAPTLRIDARAPRAVPESGVELLPTEAARDPLGAWKTTERAARDERARSAERAGAFDALLVRADGTVVEAARANVYAVLDGVVCTPRIADGALPGIVRGLLLEQLAGAREAGFDLDDLRRASEVWITSSGVRAAAVRAIRGLREDYPGPRGPAFVCAQAALRRCEAAYRDRTAAG